MAIPADVSPPAAPRDKFIAWMVDKRKEDPKFLGERWDRLQDMVFKKDVWDAKDIRAYLLTPREEFVTKANLDRTYVWHYLDIGFGVTITGPHTVGRMTNTLDVSPTDKVLEIGTGSGYQSAYLSNLTPHVWTIEIIPALAQRTRHVYDGLIQRGYLEYAAITTKNADGYYGWEENAPFDKIIVTCGIDHVPPPLLHQLKPGGIMVIPVGPPGAQHVLKITTARANDGTINVARADIYGGTPIPFVPFTKWEGGVAVGTHNN
jgi:protein-L-isoaspartate(D-aspartate) O-methyltransferase